jgi:hypothetical protein
MTAKHASTLAKTVTNQCLTAATLLCAVSALTACGSSSQSTNGASSNATAQAINSSESAAASAGWAECTTYSASVGTLSGGITDYYANSVLDTSQARVRLTSIDAGFQNNGYKLQMFRWQVSGSTPTLDSNALTFNVQPISGASRAMPSNASNLTYINYSTMASIASATGIAIASPSDFFNSFVLVVQGVDLPYEAIKLVLYDTSGIARDQADSLIPVFQANPNVYSNNHASVLNQLHPFASQASQSNSDAQWGLKAQQLCF